MESLLVPLLSAAIGWAIRHFGILAPAGAAPQSRPQSGGTVSPSGAQADLPSLIQSLVSQEVQKGVAYLESRLLPPSPSPASPQS